MLLNYRLCIKWKSARSKLLFDVYLGDSLIKCDRCILSCFLENLKGCPKRKICVLCFTQNHVLWAYIMQGAYHVKRKKRLKPFMLKHTKNECFVLYKWSTTEWVYVLIELWIEFEMNGTFFERKTIFWWISMFTSKFRYGWSIHISTFGLKYKQTLSSMKLK